MAFFYIYLNNNRYYIDLILSTWFHSLYQHEKSKQIKELRLIGIMSNNYRVPERKPSNLKKCHFDASEKSFCYQRVKISPAVEMTLRPEVFVQALYSELSYLKIFIDNTNTY